MRLAEAPRGAEGAERAKSRVGRRALWAYGLLALALLIPGIVLRTLSPIVDESAVSPLRLAAQKALEPISFMSGLRFWLGVAGTTMMALLLLYPLRKRFGTARMAGSVGGWFHVHLALGLLGPALILYHANFGFGSFNANVALWSVSIVVASGLVALTVYLTASERMARAKGTAADTLDDILRILRPPGHHDLAGTRLADDIRTIHQRIVERKSVFLDAHLRREKVLLIADAVRYINDASTNAGAAPREAAQLAANFRACLLSSLSAAQGAARSAAIERGMRLWRLLHLPVIAVGVIATALHVHAVWGVTDETPATAPTVPPPVLVTPPAPVAKAGTPIEIAGVRQKPFAVKPPAPPAVASEAASAVAAKDPELKQGPMPVTRPRTVEAAPPTPTSFNPPPKSASAPQVAQKEPVPKAKPVDEGAAVIAELKRRNDAAPRRIGDLGGLTLAAKIAELKNSAFDHARTNFPLTGKHKRVACENCHTKTLIDTPRDCIACHKKDDVHRGRRPDCASCHTTNRWSEINRRR